MTALNIGDAAKASGVSAKMIRHYEQAGLFAPASRSDGGYRQYGERDVATLRFVRQARDLGFSLEQIRELLGLWQDRARPSRQVKSVAQSHLDELDRKLRELQAMKATLQHLVDRCHGDERPGCPILDSLAGGKGVAATASGTVAAQGCCTAPAPTRRRLSGRSAGAG